MVITGLCTSFKIWAFLLNSFTKFTRCCILAHDKRIVVSDTVERARARRNRSARHSLSWSIVKGVDTMIWFYKLVLKTFGYTNLKCTIYRCLRADISFGFTRSRYVSTRFSRSCTSVGWHMVWSRNVRWKSFENLRIIFNSAHSDWRFVISDSLISSSTRYSKTCASSKRS
jgi:hypothetical protein